MAGLLNIEENKARFIELINKHLEFRGELNRFKVMLDDTDFFLAPSSGSYHLCCQGGLCQHSLNVYDTAMKLAETLGYENLESVAIASLLHDLGKIGDHGKANYVVNMINSKKKDEKGEYIKVQSDAKPYSTNSELLYIDHEIRSVSIAERYINLTEEEEFAILYHNGLYGSLKYAISGKETKLYMIIHTADMWASRFMED